jgi:hypothetical protein
MGVGIWEHGDSLYEQSEPHRTVGHLHGQISRDVAIALSKSKSDIDYLLSLVKDGGAETCPQCGYDPTKWVTIGTVKVDIENETETFIRATAPTESGEQCGGCSTCGHDTGPPRLGNGRCAYVIRDTGGSLVNCGCKCVFPATEQAGEQKNTPLCPVHQRLEDSNRLQCEIGGNNCVACSLNERAELLRLLAPFAVQDRSEDSLTVMQRVIDFYNTHSGENRVVVSYPAPVPLVAQPSDSHLAEVAERINNNAARMEESQKVSTRELTEITSGVAQAEVERTIDRAIDAMRTTQRLFDLSDNHILMVACRDLAALADRSGTATPSTAAQDAAKEVLRALWYVHELNTESTPQREQEIAAIISKHCGGRDGG